MIIVVSMSVVEFRHWAVEGPADDDAIAARLGQEADHCYRWSNGPGAQYGVHSHPYRKILYVSQGSITFTPHGQPAVTMRPGDRIEIPAGTAHGASVGDRGVACWEGQAKAG